MLIERNQLKHPKAYVEATFLDINIKNTMYTRQNPSSVTHKRVYCGIHSATKIKTIHEHLYHTIIFNKHTPIDVKN